MDPVSSAASLLQLVQLATTLSTLAFDLIRRFREAPEQLRNAASHLRMVQCQLELLSGLSSQLPSMLSPLSALSPGEVKQLHEVFVGTCKILENVRDSIVKQTLKTGKASKLMWVIRDEADMKSIVARLRGTESSLNSIILLLHTRLWNLIREDMQLSRSAQLLLGDNVAAIRRGLQPYFQRYEGYTSSRYVLSQHSREAFWRASTYISAPGNDPRLDANLSTYWYQRQKRYRISLRLLLQRYVPYMLSLDFTFCWLESGGFSVLWQPSQFVKCVVEEGSQIMTACKKGDVPEVRELLRTRKASPFDATATNSMPIRYAIESGSLELVQLLVNEGVSPSTTFGLHGTSALDWAFAYRNLDIIRFLLSQGADIYCINNFGWSPAFRLFNAQEEGSVGEQFLQILSSMSTDFDLQDALGWSCMHRAAAYGDPSDLAALIRLGGTTTLLTYGMEWTPAFIAVRFSNVSNLLELTKNLPPSFIEDRDARGWTLLHNAADVGKEEMMRVLLGLGANPHLKSKETSFRVPSGLEDRALTPEDVASNTGEDAFIAYVRALRASGHDITVDDEDLTIFWPAES